VVSDESAINLQHFKIKGSLERFEKLQPASLTNRSPERKITKKAIELWVSVTHLEEMHPPQPTATDDGV
jgi:hypothetical protein